MDKKFNHIFTSLALLALVTISCNLSFSAPVSEANLGSIGGIISGDLNGNGLIDTEEGLLDNVIVTLSGCGETQTALSGANGYFEFSNLPAGICILEVTKGGWEFSAAVPDTGYPMPVTVEAGNSVAISFYMQPTDTSLPGVATVQPTISSAPTDVSSTATPNVTATPSAAMVSPTTQDVNCRFGPSTKYSATDALLIGNTVPITGKTADSSWWQVDGPRFGNGKCFVAASVTQTSGGLGSIPVVQAPKAYVTDVKISVDAVKGLLCSGPHDVKIETRIFTNGPATIEYRHNIGGELVGLLEGFYETIEVDKAGETLIEIEPDFGICGDFFVEAEVKSPNKISKKLNFSLPGPSQNGVPVIEFVDIRKVRSGGSLTVYQDIHFQDSDGDVITADWELISTTASEPVTVSDGTVTKSQTEQMGGTIHTGTWGCGTSIYDVEFQIILIDEAGHHSSGTTYSFSCD